MSETASPKCADCGHSKDVHTFLAEGHLPHCSLILDKHNTQCPCKIFVDE